jgi:DMSO reductase family type II enzyme heme b subunit
MRAGGKLCFRLRWDDPTEDAPRAPGRKSGTGGAPEHLYKRPTGHTNAFADAAAVQVPRRWTGPAFHSLRMGDRTKPVKIYYWNASRGAEELQAAGRATPQPAGGKLPHKARHDGAGWTLTLAAPEPPAGYPLAFAVWDGNAGDRDGLKFFSIWYVLVKE